MNVADFRERIIRLRPNNAMGLNGAGAGVLGAASSGSDALMQLQRATIEFTRAYQAHDNAEELTATRKEVVAKIMVAHAFDAITEQQADELLLALQQLMKERKL